MTKPFCKLLVLALISLLCSCSSQAPSQQSKKLIGTATGAAAGAALGAGANSTPALGPLTMVGTGAIVGAFIGSTYGSDMEDSDKEKAFKAIAEGKSASWTNPSSKMSYLITPAAECSRFEGNSQCRRFSASQTEDGKTRKIIRTACKGSSGDWYIAH